MQQWCEREYVTDVFIILIKIKCLHTEWYISLLKRESSKDDVMGLKTSDRLTDTLELIGGTLTQRGERQKNQPRYQELHKSSSTLGTISRCFKVPHSSVQTSSSKYRYDENVQPSCRSRRRILWMSFGLSENLSQNQSKRLCWLNLVRQTVNNEHLNILEERGLKLLKSDYYLMQ